MTVRRALREREAEGLVLAAPGRGWLIREGRLEEPENELLPFCAAAAVRGLRPTSRVLVARSREATFEEAEALAAGAPVLRADQVTFDAVGRPVQLCRIAYRGDRYRFQASLGRRT